MKVVVMPLIFLLGVSIVWIALQSNSIHNLRDEASRSASPHETTNSVAPSPQTEHVLTVSPAGGADCTTISQAIEEAMPGDYILIRPGIYTEGLTIDKNVNLIGDGPWNSIIIRTVDQSCIYTAGGPCRIEGMALQCSSTSHNSYPAVLANFSKIVLDDCSISSRYSAAISVFDGASANLGDCRIHDSLIGLKVDDGGLATLTSCDISNNKENGIEENHRGRLDLLNCQIHDNKEEGLYVRSGGQANIVQTSFHHNTRSGARADGGRIFVNNSSFYSNQEDGILLADGARGLTTRCIVYGNKLNGIGTQTDSAVEARNCQLNSNEGFG